MENSKIVSTQMFHKLKLCKEDGIEEVNKTDFRRLVGCLMYLIATRPNILHVVSVLSRFLMVQVRFMKLLNVCLDISKELLIIEFGLILIKNLISMASMIEIGENHWMI